MNRTQLPDDSATATRALLDYMHRPDYRPLPQRQLMHRMNVGPADRPVMRRLIRRLLDEGKLAKISQGRLVAAPGSGALTGRLHRHRDGFAFVVLDSGGEDLFIPPRNLSGGLTGDRVTVRVTGRGRMGRLQGVIVRTLERRSRTVLGVLRIRGRSAQVQPFDPTLGEMIRIPTSFRGGAEHEQAVRVEIVRDPADGRPAEGKVIELLGRLGEPGTDVVIVARKYGLAMEMPRAVRRAEEELPTRVGPRATRDRERFADPAPVTIDGESAKDFDDAIAVKALPRGGFRLFVHIADVAHFVAPGSILDREARRRGTSVYFPERVLPMFPEKLSNDLCSLRPGVDRLVQSVVLDIDATGIVRKVRFADGVIRSAARLTYTQVAGVLEGSDRVRGVPARVLPMLRAAGKLRAILGQRRRERGSVDFDLPEPQIVLDMQGAMTGISVQPRNEAHQLIEEFMLAANEAVALHLEQSGSACMYRVHDTPDPAKIENLRRFVETFGLTLEGGSDELEPGAVRRLLERAEGRPELALISQVALRSMKQARYCMQNRGHFGLAAPSYCHFTSPIRRYPDLVVHRLLRAQRSGKRGVGEGDLDSVADSSSELERNAESAERELLVRKKIEYIRDKVGERFASVVTGVTPFGLFVQLTDNLVEGLIRAADLGAERFEFDGGRMELRGSRTGQAFRLGDRLTVRVDRVDRILQRVDFSLAADTGAERSRGERKKPSRPAPNRATGRRRQAGRRRARGRGRG